MYLATIWATQPIHSLLVGCLNPCSKKPVYRLFRPSPLPLSRLSNLGAHLEDGMSDAGFTEVLCNTQALEKAEAEVKLLSEEDRILCATIVERKPQVVRVAADISQAQEQKVQFLKVSGCYKMRRKTCIYLFMHSSPNPTHHGCQKVDT